MNLKNLFWGLAAVCFFLVACGVSGIIRVETLWAGLGFICLANMNWSKTA